MRILLAATLIALSSVVRGASAAGDPERPEPLEMPALKTVARHDSTVWIRAILDDSTGWSFHAERKGVEVYQKPIERLGLTAFMGHKVLAAGATPDALFDALADLGHHPEINDVLVESSCLAEERGERSFCQVMRGPRFTPVAKRYWFNRNRDLRDIEGVAGHHRGDWARLPPSAYPAVRADIRARYPGAVELPLTIGSWETLPLAGGRFRVIFRTVSDPGGSVPRFLVDWATRRALPDNILRFERDAIRRAGERRSDP